MQSNIKCITNLILINKHSLINNNKFNFSL